MERYGIDLTPEMTREWEDRIKNSRDGAVTLGSNHGGRNRSLVAVKHEGVWVPVIFDTSTSSILTVLPPQAIDHCRALLEPVTVPESEPPITCDVISDLPAVPEVPDAAGVEELDRAIAAIAARQAEATRRLQSGCYVRPETGNLVAEIARVAQTKRELKKRRHVAYTRGGVVARGLVTDPEDPISVLLALYKANHAIAARFGWENLTEEEHNARHAAKFCLGAHGLVNI